MRPFTRVAVALSVGLMCLLSVGLVGPSAGATMATKAKAKQVRSNTHQLAIVLVAYATDNDSRFPAFVSNVHFRTLLRHYLAKWPVNPYSGAAIRQKHTAGNFTYSTNEDRTTFKLIGWGPHGRRIAVFDVTGLVTE